MNTIKFTAVILMLLLASCESQKKYAAAQDKATLCETNFLNLWNPLQLVPA